MNGNVGIGTVAPAAGLDVTSGVRPGNFVTGQPCSSEGTMGYDASAHKPIYCGNSLVWTQTGGISSCIVVNSDSTGSNGMKAGTTITASCPSGYIMTGGGCSTWNTGYIEDSFPASAKTWSCQDLDGRVGAYAVCCK